jgi:hypothetical protein
MGAGSHLGRENVVALLATKCCTTYTHPLSAERSAKPRSSLKKPTAEMLAADFADGKGAAFAIRSRRRRVRVRRRGRALSPVSDRRPAAW